jgi:hypothetical protein
LVLDKRVFLINNALIFCLPLHEKDNLQIQRELLGCAALYGYEDEALQAVTFLTWVEGVAGHIGDPVARLRFLRVAAPVVAPGAKVKSRWLNRSIYRDAMVLLFLLAAFGLVYGRFARPSAVPAPSRMGHSAKVKAK